MRIVILGAEALALAVSSALAQTPAALLRPPPPSPPRISNPDWERTATSVDLARLYPNAARAHGQSGHTTMRCKILADGALTGCEIIEECPTGFGFGDAALKTARYFKLHHRTVDGAPVEGGTIIIPIGWRLSADAPAPVCPAGSSLPPPPMPAPPTKP